MGHKEREVDATIGGDISLRPLRLLSGLCVPFYCCKSILT